MMTIGIKVDNGKIRSRNAEVGAIRKILNKKQFQWHLPSVMILDVYASL